jgi:hypothetical protein
MKQLLLVFGILIGISLVVGCTVIGEPDLPTPYPTEYLPTVIVLTADASQKTSAAALDPVGNGSSPTATTLLRSQTPTVIRTHPTPTQPPASATARPTATPSRTPTPSLTSTHARPTRTPTVTPTVGVPEAAIQILNLGPVSKIVSPLEVNLAVRTVPQGSLRIEVWLEPLQPGQESRLLLRELRNFNSNPAPWINLQEELDFEISRVSELAQLRVGTYDEYGRVVALGSVDLILLSSGDSDRNPPGDLLEPIYIQEPIAKKLIQGGVVTVTGLARPYSQPTLLLELVARDGRVVGYRQLAIIPGEKGVHIPFVVDVPYLVTEPTWARLTAQEGDLRIPGIRYVASIEVLLSP